MRNYLALALLLLPAIICAQEKTIQGLVLEESLKGKFQAIQAANVYWLGTTIGTTSDSNGVFTIPIVASSNKLVISYLGYQSDTIVIAQSKKITVVLKNARNLNEVKIEFRKKSTSISTLNPIKVEQISQKELFKAACCNLSESFETNPSVDVAFTDAVTGTKQIQLLGLASSYTQITQENIPAIRGLSTNYGLGLIPGTWIESMQLSKGTGSVVNGYESIAGQLNVELHKPEGDNRLIINGYASQGGRYESNLVVNQAINEHLHTGLLLHTSTRTLETDNNQDGFMDNPLGKQLGFINRWDYHNDNGLESQFGVAYSTDEKTGGQLGYQSSQELTANNLYGVYLLNKRFDAFAKTGYLFPGNKYKSIGLQLAYHQFDQQSRFGLINKYAGEQTSLYANLIFQNIISTTDHKYRTGISWLNDNFIEQFNDTLFKRRELVPGVFFEYTWTASEKVSVVTGIRGDYHNLYGAFVTPRLHLRYAPLAKSVLRFSAGRGQKTANILAENSGVMASSRAWVFNGFDTKLPYGLKQEIAWNVGLNFTQNFTIDYRDGYFSIDFYRSDFKNQVVVDLDATAREVRFYNLAGSSFANSFQVEASYELLKHFDVRMAYRYYDVQTQYGNSLLTKPLVSKHRAFVNLAYETRTAWSFDYTLNWVGSKRLPNTSDNLLQYQLAKDSPSYFLMSAQVTKKFKERFEAYLGVENITNFIQTKAIIGNDDPFGNNFDSSMIWGPVFGRMAYLGFRYTIKNKAL